MDLDNHTRFQKLIHYLSNSCSQGHCIKGHVFVCHGRNSSKRMSDWFDEHEHHEVKE